jgi:hypothetical protein
MKRILLAIGSTVLLFSTGCSSSLAQPFQTLKAEPITIYRLQNFEPPAAPAPGLPGAPNAAIPPQIQQWLNGAATMLPPGLIPPGLLPGGTPAPAASADAQRFHNFRILGKVQVTDTKQRDEIQDLMGHESNFVTPNQSCMYAEFGFQFGQGAAGGLQGTPSTSQPADVLVSLSCDQVQMFNYGWPYGTKTGISADSAKRIAAIVQKAFGG